MELWRWWLPIADSCHPERHPKGWPKVLNRSATKSVGRLTDKHVVRNRALPRNAGIRVRSICRCAFSAPWPRKPRPNLRRVLRHPALRNRTGRRPPARRILRHLAHLRASAARLRHPAMAITRAIPMRQQNARSIGPGATRQKHQRRRNRHRAQTHPLNSSCDRPPEGVPVHTASLCRFQKKTDSSQPHPIPLQK
jgi:hypothetical protein